MNNEARSLLKQAFSQAMAEKYDAELAALGPAITPSAHYLRCVSRMIGIDVQRAEDRRRYRKKRLLICVIAAVLAITLSVSAYAYRDGIRKLFLTFYDKYVNATYDSDLHRVEHQKITEVYALSYVPDGFELEQTLFNDSTSYYRWRNEKGETITFSQKIFDNVTFGYDTEHGEYTVWQYENFEVHVYSHENSRSYLWNDGKYAFVIDTTCLLSEEQVKQMIDSIILE